MTQKGLLLPVETRREGRPEAGLLRPQAHGVQRDMWQGREPKGRGAPRRPPARAEASRHAIPSLGGSGISTRGPQESQ